MNPFLSIENNNETLNVYINKKIGLCIIEYSLKKNKYQYQLNFNFEELLLIQKNENRISFCFKVKHLNLNSQTYHINFSQKVSTALFDTLSEVKRNFEFNKIPENNTEI
jgi:hypothetical protein